MANLENITAAGEELIASIFTAEDALARFDKAFAKVQADDGNSDQQGLASESLSRFIDRMVEVWEAYQAYSIGLTDDAKAAFSSVTRGAVRLPPCDSPYASAHEALESVGDECVSNVALLVGHAKPETEYVIQGLSKNEIEAEPGRAIVAFRYCVDEFHIIERLNEAQVLLPKELMQARQQLENAKPSADPHGANGSVRANGSRLFPRGELDNRNLVEFVYHLDSKRDGNRSDADIAREYTGETIGDESKATRLRSLYRKWRRKGRIGI